MYCYWRLLLGLNDCVLLHLMLGCKTKNAAHETFGHDKIIRNTHTTAASCKVMAVIGSVSVSSHYILSRSVL